jgi:hypothetical protein
MEVRLGRNEESFFNSIDTTTALPGDGGFTGVFLTYLGCMFQTTATAPPSFLAKMLSISSLKTLDVVHLNCVFDIADARALGACTGIQSLNVGLGEVRDKNFLELTALTGMKDLCLHFYDTWYLDEQVISQVLAAMPGLETLHLCGLEGDAAVLFDGGLHTQRLTRVELAHSRLRNVEEGLGSLLLRMKSSLNTLNFNPRRAQTCRCD